MKSKIKSLFSSEFSRILLSYASGQVLGNLLKMVAGFLTVRLIAPEVFGYFNGKGIFLGYLSLAHLGIINGLNRDLPVEQGRGNINKVNELASVGYWISLFIGIPAAFVLIILGFLALGNGNTQDAMLYFTYSISAFFLLFNKFYLPILYRTNQDFTKLTTIIIYTSIINIVTVAIVWWEGNMLGLCIRLVILNFIEFAFLYYFRPVKVLPKWSFLTIKSLIKTGIPIFIVGNISSIWDTVKNNIIFSLGGGLYYGYYALSNVVAGAVGMIPNAFNQIIYPKMAIAYGKGNSKLEIIHSTYKPILLLLGITCIITFISYFLLEPIILFVLPKYYLGIDAALWTLGLPIVMSFSLINHYFNIYKKQTYYLIGILIGIAVSAGYLFIYYRLYSFQLVMFPQSVLIGTIVQNIICWIAVIYDSRLKFDQNIIKK